MTSNELKELVKAHFSLVEADSQTETLVEETFGELKDINGAFTIKFPGDSLQVGDKVTVVTTEGQEMDAPDGEHELEDGTKIVTKDSVVEEIMSADGEKAMEEEVAEDATEEKMAEVEEVVEEIVEEVVEEIAEDMMEEPAVEAEDIVKAVVEAVQAEMKAMKEKMATLETKVAEFEAAPADEKTIPTSNAKFSVDAPKAFNSSTQELMIEMIKNKKRK